MAADEASVHNRPDHPVGGMSSSDAKETAVISDGSALQEATAANRSDYDPTIPPYRDDPFPFYRSARERGSLVFLEPIGAWAVSRYEDIVKVLHDPATFSSAMAVIDPEVGNPPSVGRLLRRCLPSGRHVVNTDPPQHSAARRIANTVFRQERISRFRPRIRALADELVDGFVAHGRAELVSQFTTQFVYRVLAELAGVDRADLERVVLWTEDALALISPVFTEERKLAAAQRLPDYDAYVIDLVDKRRAEPRDDIMSDLVHLDAICGESLDLPDLVLFWRVLFAAGVHTTKDAIGSMVLAMLEERGSWERASADPALIPALFEETLRRDAPHRGLFRVTTREVEIGESTVPAGSLLLLLFGSGNRDETHFPDPDDFCSGRPNIRDHLAFGRGIHHCLGARLARMEGAVALETLTERLPDLQLRPGYRPTYSPSYFFRGVAELEVTWPRPAVAQHPSIRPTRLLQSEHGGSVVLPDGDAPDTCSPKYPTSNG